MGGNQKSIDYIEDNLTEPLEIETLAQVASLSVFIISAYSLVWLKFLLGNI